MVPTDYPSTFLHRQSAGTIMEDLERLALLSISDSQPTELSIPTQARLCCRWGAECMIPRVSGRIWYFSRRDFEGVVFGISPLLNPNSIAGRILQREGPHWGKPLLDKAVEVKTCGGTTRPAKFYRAVHNKSCGGGIYARGKGMGTDEVNFQIRVEKHLDWDCRTLSPFLSVFSKQSDAERRCNWYKERGFQGIELLEMESAGPGWNHDKQLFWKVEDLVNAFGLEWQPYYKNEYLIEQSIPRECVTSIRWK